MEDDTGMTDSGAISSCSVSSSLLPHCSSEELLTNTENLQTTTEEMEKIGRTRKLLNKLNRGNALDLQPKLSSFAENIDLTTPDDKIDLFAQQFPHLVKSRSKVIKSAPEKPRNGVDAQKRVKEQLSSRLAARRRAEQEKRRALYAEDNEDIMSDDEEEEEEYEVKKKTKLSKPKPVDSDNSEDDEDYKEGDGSGDGGESSDEENEVEEADDERESEGEEPVEEKEDEESQPVLKESEDVFADSQSTAKPVDLPDSMEVSEIPSQEPAAPSQFPTSLSQFWVGSQKPPSEKEGSDDGEKADDDEVGKQFVDKNPIKDDDLLMFCSGAFDLPPAKAKKPVEVVENEEEDVIRPTQHKAKKRVVQSDDEDETVTEGPAKVDEEKEEKPAESVAAEEEAPSEEKEGPRRVVLLSDDESDAEGNEAGEEDVEGENEEEDAENEEEEVVEEEEEKVEEGDGGSDDELAVFRRMERAEYKKKIKLDTFVDEEADLSGDDVGSDADEDGEDNNEYEADECDQEIFDTNEMRQKNHKLFMKQEQQEIHRDIANLQDRLLADGDLAGVETNRSFRVKLRTDETEVDLATLSEYSQDSVVEEETVEDEKKRADAIRFKADMHSVISNVESDPFDDALEHAASAALLAKITVKETRVAPTLLGKTPLANAVKDITGGIVARQLYKQTTDSSLSNNKRHSDCAGNVAKKHKLNLLDSLDD